MRRRAARGGLWTLLCSGAFVMGCGVASPPTGAEKDGAPVSADVFIEVVSAIRVAERETADEDSAAVQFAERRRRILDRYGVDQATLEEFVRYHAEDTELLRAVWNAINEQLKHEVEAKEGPLEGRPGFRVR